MRAPGQDSSTADPFDPMGIFLSPVAYIITTIKESVMIFFWFKGVLKYLNIGKSN